MNCGKLFILNVGFNGKVKPEDRIKFKDVTKEFLKSKMVK